jgi:hypothetical protein
MLLFSSGNSYQGGLHEGREPGGRSVKLNRVVKLFLMSAGRYNPLDSKLALVGQGALPTPGDSAESKFSLLTYIAHLKEKVFLP